MAKIPWYGSGRGNYGSGTQNFLLGMVTQNQTGTEALAQQTVRGSAGTFSNLYTRIFSNGITATSTLRFRKGGANGNQVVSIGSSATGEFEDASNTDAVVAGDLINLQFVIGGTGTNIRPGVFGCQLAATTNTVSRPVALSLATTAASSTVFGKFVDAGRTAVGAETTTQQFKMKVAGTLKNLNVNVTANARATSATTFGNRLNGGAGAMSVSVGTSATGQFEDTSNSNALVSGDLVDWSITTGAGTQSITATLLADFVTTDGSAQCWVGSSVSQALSLTRFYPPMGDLGAQSSTESDTQAKCGVAATLSQYECFISANTVSAASTLTFRKNGANGNGAVSITASTTGWFQDATNSDSLVSADEMGFQLVTGGAGTSLTIDAIGYKLATVSVSAPSPTRVVQSPVMHTRREYRSSVTGPHLGQPAPPTHRTITNGRAVHTIRTTSRVFAPKAGTPPAPAIPIPHRVISATLPTRPPLTRSRSVGPRAGSIVAPTSNTPHRVIVSASTIRAIATSARVTGPKLAAFVAPRRLVITASSGILPIRWLWPARVFSPRAGRVIQPRRVIVSPAPAVRIVATTVRVFRPELGIRTTIGTRRTVLSWMPAVRPIRTRALVFLPRLGSTFVAPTLTPAAWFIPDAIDALFAIDDPTATMQLDDVTAYFTPDLTLP